MNAGQLPRTIAAGELLPVKATLAATFEEGLSEQEFHVQVAGFRGAFRAVVHRQDVMPFPAEVELGPFEQPMITTIVMHELAWAAGLRVIDARCHDDRLRVAVTRSHEINFTVESLDIGERIDTFCDVTLDGTEALARQRLWVSGMASGGLVADPPDLQFGLLRVDGSTVTREAHIWTVDGRTFELVLAASKDSPVLDVTLRQISSVETVVAVAIHPRRHGILDVPIKLTTPDGMRGVILRCLGTIE